MSNRPPRRARTVILAVVGVVALVVLLLWAVTGIAAAQSGGTASPQGPVLDGIRDVYRLAARGWRARLVPVAQRTFMLLAGIEFAVSGLVWTVKRESLDELAAKFLLKFTLIAFLLSLITSFDLWFPAIVNGFASAGESVVGHGVLSPSAIIDLGGETSYRILQALSLTIGYKDLIVGFFTTVCALVICGAYVAIAVQLLLVMVESYVVVLGGGVLFLGFAASRWTAAYAEHIIGHAVYVGVKIFLLYLVVGVGMDIARGFVPLIQSATLTTAASPLLQITGGAVAFAAIAIRIPNGIAWRLTGHTSFGIAQALRSLS